jgi:ribose 5-phosphate isomerase A
MHMPAAPDPGPLDRAKRAAGRAAAAIVPTGCRLGLGTGSTAERFLEALAERCAAGLRLGRVVATSETIARRAASLGIDAEHDPEAVGPLDLDVDGADAWDRRGRLLKGYGGALLREKLVAQASARLVVIVDPSKEVRRLDLNRRVPVEVVPFAWRDTAARLRHLGLSRVEPRLEADGSLFVTDGGHHLLDVGFPAASDRAGVDAWARRIKAVPGVVEHGLFVGLPVTVVVGRADGTAVTYTARADGA